jgi:hypothetical protein
VDAGVGEAALIEVKDGIDEVGCTDVGGAHGLAMETKSLRGDLADAGELVLRGVDVAADVVGEIVGQIDQIEKIGDGFEGVVDLVRDGAGEAAHGSELFTLDEGGFRFFLRGDLEDDSGDGFDSAAGTSDRRVTDVPETMLTGASGKFAFEEEISNLMALSDLLEDLGQAFERSEFKDRAAKDLLSWEAEGFALTIVDADIAEFDGVEE